MSGFVYKIMLFPNKFNCFNHCCMSGPGFLPSSHDAHQLNYLMDLCMNLLTLCGISVQEGTAFHLLHFIPQVSGNLFTLLSLVLFFLCIYFYISQPWGQKHSFPLWLVQLLPVCFYSLSVTSAVSVLQIQMLKANYTSFVIVHLIFQGKLFSTLEKSSLSAAL